MHINVNSNYFTYFNKYFTKVNHFMLINIHFFSPHQDKFVKNYELAVKTII